MKKLASIFSVALICAFGANAATVASQAQKVAKRTAPVQATLEVTSMPSSMTFERITPAPRRAASGVTANNYVGLYKWKSTNSLQGESFPTEGFLSIMFDSNNNLIIDGLISIYPLNGKFNASTGHVDVPNQEIPYWIYEGGEKNNETMMFMNYTAENGMNNGQAGYRIIEADANHPFYFDLDENDNLRGYGDIVPAIWNNHQYTNAEIMELWNCPAVVSYQKNAQGLDEFQGYYFMAYWIEGDRMEEYQVKDSEWTYAGDAEFTDAWFPIFWTNGVTPTYNVPLYYNNVTPDLYMLKNPYGPETPYGEEDLNLGTKPGHIILDLADPYCVCVRPLVYALTVEDEDEQGQYIESEIYVYNLEGQFAFTSEMSTEDIIILLDVYGYTASSFDANTREVIIRNPVLSTASSPASSIWWGGYDDFTGKVVLPVGYNAVESVLGEENNAPVEYFNLQGARVQQPQKGQFVIVRKGNVTTKEVVR